MSSVPHLPNRAELAAVMASAKPRAMAAALAIKPPDNVNPQDVKIVEEELRKAAEARGGVDITV
ncbi:MAG: hypothetical protein ACOYJ6_00415 [Caulobacterales bacterium]